MFITVFYLLRCILEIVHNNTFLKSRLTIKNTGKKVAPSIYQMLIRNRYYYLSHHIQESLNLLLVILQILERDFNQHDYIIYHPEWDTLATKTGCY